MRLETTRTRIEDEILSYLGRHLPEEKQANHLLTLLMDAYPLLSSAVLAVDKSRSPLVFAHRGLSGNFIKELYAKGTLPVVDEALSEEVALSAEDSRLGDPAWRFEHDCQSLFAAPCRVQGEVLGAFLAESPEPGLFDGETREAFRAYAQISAVFLALRGHHHDLSRVPDIDSLTGLNNFRFFHEVLHRELARARKLGNPVSLLFLKIRHLREMNDTYGHVEADRALIDLARNVKAQLRDVDFVSRSGSNVYIVMPETAKEEARQVALRILAAAQGRGQGSAGVTLRTAVGVAAFPVDGSTERELIPHAESMVHESVRKGGDALTVFGD